ncbi:MAG: hypothetical protein B1H08_06200 [Candidatus Omnitrophica bacterium 4484_171]|nr:MAG: hypothetical protein B1H08_06200 [Candidatus Omnitrophica bacterium 4484_171]
MNSNFVLDEFQKNAIDSARKGFSVIVSAPTGAGKTLIAEYIIEDCIRNREGIIYTAPVKALSNQKFRDFSRKYPKNVGIVTGDVSINPSAPIIIMTTEIFRNAILISPQRFNDKKWVIFDEIHYLDDIERGTVWEETIILLPEHMHILALSATLPNIDEFIKWLNSVHRHPIKKIVEQNRPVPLDLRYQCSNTIFNTHKELKESGLMDKRSLRALREAHIKPNKLNTLMAHLQSKELTPCIYFSFSRRRCETLAYELHGLNLLSKEEKKEIVHLFNNLINIFNVANDPHINLLFPLVKQGIGYHHAGILPALKEVIERLFTTGLLKLIFTTETFALGVNMPAKTVIFDTLYKYYGRTSHYLKTRDFYQMAGRAGRRGIDTRGYVYTRINPYNINMDNLDKIIYGSYEPITSQLRSCYATILNLYKLMKEKLYEIYPRSFHFQQSERLQKKEALDLLKRKVSLLEYMKYIVNSEISAKAELSARVYSFELQIGELYDTGILNSLNELSLFILMCALVYEPRKGEKKPRFTNRIKKMRKELKNFTKYIHKAEKKFRIYPLSKRFSFNITEAARAWYEGADFYKLHRFCWADEGEIVRYFRMAIQVLKEVRTSYIVEPALKSRINKCIKRINRDVIDAERQLREDII